MTNFNPKKVNKYINEVRKKLFKNNEEFVKMMQCLTEFTEDGTINTLMPVPEEVRKEADEIRNELSHTCSFYAMAYVESLFRIDSFVRVKHKCKGDVTPLIKKMVQSKEKLSLVRFEDLLDAWEATHADERELFREVKQAFQFRHWMAHGRYWKPNDNIDKHFDFEDIYSLVSAVESLLGGELRTQDAIGNPLRINELYKI